MWAVWGTLAACSGRLCAVAARAEGGWQGRRCAGSATWTGRARLRGVLYRVTPTGHLVSSRLVAAVTSCGCAAQGVVGLVAWCHRLASAARDLGWAGAPLYWTLDAQGDGTGRDGMTLRCARLRGSVASRQEENKTFWALASMFCLKKNERKKDERRKHLNGPGHRPFVRLRVSCTAMVSPFFPIINKSKEREHPTPRTGASASASSPPLFPCGRQHLHHLTASPPLHCSPPPQHTAPKSNSSLDLTALTCHPTRISQPLCCMLPPKPNSSLDLAALACHRTRSLASLLPPAPTIRPPP